MLFYHQASPFGKPLPNSPHFLRRNAALCPLVKVIRGCQCLLRAQELGLPSGPSPRTAAVLWEASFPVFTRLFVFF